MPDRPDGPAKRQAQEEPTLLAEARSPAAAAIPPGADGRLQPGTVLGGRYEILERLGEGGTGAVYAARDRLIGEDVALKVLHERLRGDGAELTRLRAEVRAARRIAHPNVCRVHDLCEQGGLVWVVMELLRGETLRRRLRRELSFTDALEVARQLGAGLAAAHRAGVVHCDVKPENALVEPDRVVLTDFGIARLLGVDRAAAAARTGGATGEAGIEGTPAYMAPEQLLARPVDERTDVYGLAAVIFELLAGAPPFGSLAAGEPLTTLVNRILQSEARLPAGRPTELAAEARTAVDAVLGHALAKEPAHRYETVDALVAAVVAAAGVGGGAGRAARREAPLVPDLVTAVSMAAVESTPGTRSTPTPSRTAARPRGARRVATVVHAAVEEAAVGDEEIAADRVEALLAAAETALVDAGGAVVGRAPRSVVAVFGASASRGDEPVRAADAARAVTAAAAGVREAAVRLGIDTGRLLVRAAADGSPAVSGDALARAARLAAGAAPGAVVVSTRTSRHLVRRFVLAPLGEDALRIAGRRAADASESPVALVGREIELGRLLDELAGAARDGWPRGALVLGAPGVGKSRLRREIVDTLAARAGLQVVTVAAEPDDALASHALARTILRRTLGVPGGVSAEEAASVAQRALRRGKGAAPAAEDQSADRALLGALAALLGDRALGPGVPALAAARAAVAAAAAARPLLVVVDDVHWADDASMDLVESLARGEVQAPVALLALGRPEVLDRRPRLKRAFGVALELPPLRGRQAAELAAHLLGAPGALDDPRVRAVADACDGNPFFVEELARDILERGDAPAGAAPPSTVEEAIQARLDRLSPDEREVLRAASVLGRIFRRRDLADLLVGLEGGPPVADLDRVLLELEGRRILFALPPDAASDDRYALKHALVRDVAYGELVPAVRRALHASAARVLAAGRGEGTPDADSVEHLVELARHLEGADDRAAAAAAWRRAGGHAAAHGDQADAYRCYQRARELLGAEPDIDLLIRLGEAGLATGAVGEAEAALDDAIARAERDRDARCAAARALHARAAGHKQRGQWEPAIALARRGLELVDEAAEPVLAARLRSLLGWILGYMLGDNDRGLPESLRAVALLDGTSHLHELAAAYSALGGNYARAGRWRDQLACNRKVLELGEQVGAPDIVARSTMHIGLNLASLGELDEALPHLRRALALFERMCATVSVALARDNLGGILVELGRLDEADRELAAAAQLADRCGGTYFRSDIDLYQARIAARRGDLAGARRLAEGAVDRAVADASRIDEGAARKVLGAVLSLARDHDAAWRELDAARALLEGADLGEVARVHADRARALARRGDTAGAEHERAEARARFEALGAAHDLRMLDDDSWI